MKACWSIYLETVWSIFRILQEAGSKKQQMASLLALGQFYLMREAGVNRRRGADPIFFKHPFWSIKWDFATYCRPQLQNYIVLPLRSLTHHFFDAISWIILHILMLYFDDIGTYSRISTPISNHFPTKTLTGCSALLVHGRGCHGASPGAELDTTQQTQQRWLKHWDPGCHSATNSHMQELDDTASWEAPFGKTFVMMLEHRVEPLEKHWKHYDWILGCGLKT